jgi:hypothetical protein
MCGSCGPGFGNIAAFERILGRVFANGAEITAIEVEDTGRYIFTAVTCLSSRQDLSMV